VQFGLDVLSLLTMGLGEIPDHEVLRLARSAGRIVITLDRDFAQPFSTAGRIEQGIIYLDLPNSRRYVPDIQQILGAFFQDEAATIDLEHTLVILREDRMEIRRS
jgi:predicted nuclease of predicted toxin-antitoxin system